MRFFKKPLCLFLCVCSFLILFSSCKGQNQLNHLNTAFTQTRELKELHYSVSSSNTFSVYGISTPIDFEMEIWMKKNEDALLEFKSNLEVSADSVSFQLAVYYQDSYLYFEIEGEKVKIKIDPSLFSFGQSDFSLQNLSDYLQNDALENLRLSKGANGSEIFDFLLPSKMIQENFDKALALFNQKEPPIGYQPDIQLIATDDSSVSFTVQDNYLSSESYTIPCSIGSSGLTIPLVIKVSIQYIDPGKPVDISFPDFSAFQEEDLSEDLPDYIPSSAFSA